MWQIRQKVIKESCLESTSRPLYQISKSSANYDFSSFNVHFTNQIILFLTVLLLQVKKNSHLDHYYKLFA
jgi:hypothetical protein